MRRSSGRHVKRGSGKAFPPLLLSPFFIFLFSFGLSEKRARPPAQAPFHLLAPPIARAATLSQAQREGTTAVCEQRASLPPLFSESAEMRSPSRAPPSRWLFFACVAALAAWGARLANAEEAFCGGATEYSTDAAR
jgi:hypothetical protein